jgi:hypothetical protein
MTGLRPLRALLMLGTSLAAPLALAPGAAEGEEHPSRQPTTLSLDSLCDAGHDDPVTDRLCEGPAIASLVDLQRALGISIVDPRMGNGQAGNASFALLAHSTATSGRLVSSLNPRAFLFTTPASVARVFGDPVPDPNLVVLAFTRGVQEVELASRDRSTGALLFFLLRFRRACDDSADGCASHDLFSPAIESGWTSVSVVDETALVNTPLDCLTCHQPGGPGTPKMLRMNELEIPWTHFFRGLDSGQTLIDDFRSAHPPSESYAGIPARKIAHSQPTRMQGLVENEGFRQQPDVFPGAQLGFDLARGVEPAINPAWQTLQQGALARFGLPVPAPSARPYDESRLRRAAAAYREAAEGDGLYPDLTDLLSDDAEWQSGLRPRPGASDVEILEQTCKRCHHSALDPTLSRARFDTSRAGFLEEAAKRALVTRLRLPDDSPLKMPPPRFARLTEEEITRVAEALGVQ